MFVGILLPAPGQPPRTALNPRPTTGGLRGVAETEEAIREAIRFHLEGLRKDGAPIPEPSSQVEYMEVAA
jgi:hypothetical protein